MSEEPSNETLCQMIKSLDKKVEKGFSDIKDRQDKTNGAVRNNTEWRLERKDELEQLIQDKKNITSRIFDFVWRLIVTGVMVILGIKFF